MNMSDDKDPVNEYLKSEQFQKDFSDQVTKDTWGYPTKDGRGLPKIYMNELNQIVEHWKDGTINILKKVDKPKRNE